jgi:hypothetical protein
MQPDGVPLGCELSGAECQQYNTEQCSACEASKTWAQLQTPITPHNRQVFNTTQCVLAGGVHVCMQEHNEQAYACFC